MTPSLIIRFSGDLPGDPVDSYDFSSLGIGAKAANALLSAFGAITATYRTSSRRQAWRSLRKFASFLVEHGGEAWEVMRTSSVSQRFEEWLKAKLLLKTGGSHYNFVRQIYAWLGANDSARSIAWMNIYFPHGRFQREEECRRQNVLSRDEIRSVLVASKKGIDEVRARMRVMSALATGKAVPGLPDKSRDAIRRMQKGVDNGVIDKGRQYAAGYITAATPYRALKKYLFLEIPDYIPYLLYIAIETRANPGGLMELSVDCISEHPVDPLKKVFTWDKFRASEQNGAAVSVEGAYAVPTLIAELLEYTKVLRQFAGARADRLFLNQFKGRAGIVSVQSWHNELAVFIEKFGLPDFNFVDLRISGARLLGDRGEKIELIQSELQHKSSRTTGLYISSPERKGVAAAKLLGFMGSVVRSAEAERSSRRAYGTTQGYDCADATSGVAPLSREGSKCTDYLHCAFCPNSIVVLDSPKHIARMIAAKHAFDEMKEASNTSRDVSIRYKHAFERAHEVLVALLGRVPKDILRAGEKLAAAVPVIALE